MPARRNPTEDPAGRSLCADLYLSVAPVFDRFLLDMSARKLISFSSTARASPSSVASLISFGLGIRHTGAQTARDLADHSLARLEAFVSSSRDEIEGIPWNWQSRR